MSKIPRRQIKLMVTEEEMEQFTKAASAYGTPVSTWARTELRRIAFREMDRESYFRTSSTQAKRNKPGPADYSHLPPSEPPPILAPKNTTPNPADVFVNPVPEVNPFVETKEQRTRRRVDMCLRNEIYESDLTDEERAIWYKEKYGNQVL